MSVLSSLGSGVHSVLSKGIHFDPTPGFNITSSAGGGIPFIAHTGGTGIAPSSTTNTSIAPSQQVVNSNSGSGTYPTGTYSGNVLGASTVDNSALAAAYDAQIGRLNGYLGELPGQQAAQENILRGQFDQTRAGLDTSHNRSLSDLKTQNDQIVQNRARSLNDLANRGRTLMQALNNQYGTMGAGSSSASQVLAPWAISQQQNHIGGDINNQAQQQIQAVDTEKNRVEQDYKNHVDQLEQERLNNLLHIGQQFSDLARQYQDQLGNASAQKAQALGGQYNATVAQVNNAVAQIEANYRAKLADINNYYSNYHPTANTDLAPVDNNVQNLNTAGFTGLGSDPTATQQAVTTAFIDPTKQDQNQILY